MHAIRSVLARPGLLRLFLAQFLIYGQLYISFAILPLYTIHLGGDALTAGVHTALFTGAGLVLRFYFGPLADSHGRRLPLLLGAFAFATVNGLFYLSDTLFLLGAARVYQAVGLAAYLSASTALVLDLAPRQTPGTALGLNRSVIALALLIFPAAAERLVQHFGFPALFLASGLVGGLGLVLLWTLHEPGERPGRPRVTRAITVARGGFVHVLRTWPVPLVLVAMGGTALTVTTIMAFLPLHLQAMDTGGFAPFFVAMGVSAFLAGLAGPVLDRYGARLGLIVALVASGLAAALLVRGLTLPLLLPAGVLLGLGYTLGLSAATAWMALTVPAALQATAMAVSENAFDIFIAAGSPLLGALAVERGYAAVFAVLAALCAAVLGGILAAGRQ